MTVLRYTVPQDDLTVLSLPFDTERGGGGGGGELYAFARGKELPAAQPSSRALQKIQDRLG